MGGRKERLVNGETYHVFSKSIAGFRIFRNNREFQRARNALEFYNISKPEHKFSIFLKLKNKEKFYQKYYITKERLLDIIAYCFMPTHIHLLVKQLKSDGISTLMGNMLNSYSRYFNIKNKRKGPLWESRYNFVHVKTDEQLSHLTRYIHLNPVTAYLVEKPEQWKFSSYREFVGTIDEHDKICHFSGLLDIDANDYREFVSSQIDYQRELAGIKVLFLE